MSPLIEVPSTTYKGHKLPGGWKAQVPDIEIVRNDPRLRDLVTTLTKFGLRRPEAERKARELVQEFFTKSWRARLMKTVGRWAKIYAERNNGSLKGFDPERVARLWVPGVYGGRLGHGNPLMDAEFVRMRRGG